MPQGRTDGDQLIIQGRANIPALQAHDWHQDTVFGLHFPITESEGTNHFGPTDFVVLGVVAIIEIAHLIRFSVAYPLGMFVCVHWAKLKKTKAK